MLQKYILFLEENGYQDISKLEDGPQSKTLLEIDYCFHNVQRPRKKDKLPVVLSIDEVRQ